jgi:hypothetical protein
MMRVDGDIVTRWRNKLQAAAATAFTPSGVLAAQHARKAKPGRGRKSR